MPPLPWVLLIPRALTLAMRYFSGPHRGTGYAVLPGSPNLFCIPATIDLAGAEIEMVSLVRREFRLYDALHNGFLEEHGFEYVFIDCPPSSACSPSTQ